MTNALLPTLPIFLHVTSCMHHPTEKPYLLGVAMGCGLLLVSSLDVLTIANNL